MVDKIVVATAADRLRPRALETLLEVEKSSDIVVQFLAERLGFEDSSEKAPVLSSQNRNSVPGQIALARLESDVDRTNFPGKSFRLRKRIVDVFGAAFLIITLTPSPGIRRICCCVGCRFSFDILAATTRSIWTAVQTIQISDDARAARQTSKADPR